MQLQNFECQIAKAQIGRFVAGDTLSDEALHQLEAHISKCPDCQKSLAERRAALQEMLAPEEQVKQPATRTKLDISELIKSKLKSGQPVQAAVQTANPKASSFTKPALYTLALAAVLIGMSYMSRNMDSVLGPKAAATPKPEPQATNTAVRNAPTSSPVLHPQALPAKSAKSADAKPQTLAKPKSVPVASKSKPIQPKPPTSPAPKPEHRSRRHSGKGGHHESNTVRVYDPEN